MTEIKITLFKDPKLTGKNGYGALVENLEDGNTKVICSRTDWFSDFTSKLSKVMKSMAGENYEAFKPL